MTTTSTARNDVRVFPADGYTVQGYLRAIPDVFNRPLRFTYRPLPHLDVIELQDSFSKMTRLSYERKCASMMAARLIEWDLVDHKGEPMEICIESVLELGTSTFSRLFEIILGTGATDHDPGWDEGTKDEIAETEWQSVSDNTTPGQAREEANSKN